MHIGEVLRIHGAVPRLHVEIGRGITFRRSGTIDEYFDRAQAPLDLGQQSRRRFRVDEIGGDCQDLVTLFLERLARGGKGVEIARGDRHARALRGEARGAREPDPLASSRDEDSPSSEIQIHGIPCLIAKSAKIPAKMTAPTQLLWLKALKQASRSRPRMRR